MPGAKWARTRQPARIEGTMVARFRTTGPIFDRNAPQRVRSVSRAWMQGVARRTRDTVREFSPVATGGFRRSVVYRTWIRGDQVDGAVFSKFPEAATATIELGRNPNRPPPPPGSLRAWMAVKGIDPEAEDRIRWAIARRGYPGHFMFTRAYKRFRGLLNSQIRTLEVQLARELSR
jgi:hypothetical protein